MFCKYRSMRLITPTLPENCLVCCTSYPNSDNTGTSLYGSYLQGAGEFFVLPSGHIPVTFLQKDKFGGGEREGREEEIEQWNFSLSPLEITFTEHFSSRQTKPIQNSCKRNSQNLHEHPATKTLQRKQFNNECFSVLIHLFHATRLTFP